MLPNQDSKRPKIGEHPHSGLSLWMAWLRHRYSDLVSSNVNCSLAIWMCALSDRVRLVRWADAKMVWSDYVYLLHMSADRRGCMMNHPVPLRLSQGCGRKIICWWSFVLHLSKRIVWYGVESQRLGDLMLLRRIVLRTLIEALYSVFARYLDQCLIADWENQFLKTPIVFTLLSWISYNRILRSLP